MDGKNIVLLHGWGANVGKLKPLEKELERLGWRVFVPKLPGFELDPPEKVWGVSDYAEHVKEKADKHFKRDSSTSLRMTPSYFVFGHSFGGRVAIKMVVGKSGGDSIVPIESELQNDRIAGIVLCAAGGLSRGNPLKRGIFYFLAKVGKVFLLLPPVAKVFKKGLYKVAREHDYEKAEGIMRDTFKRVVNENLRPLVSKIKIPTLVLWGKQDKMTPISDAYFIKDNLPGYEPGINKLKVFENEGHQLPYKKPKEIAEEIDRWVSNKDIK